MLRNEKLDALVAPQPFDRHGQLITPLYESGLPILTEKPLASSPEIGKMMLAAIQSGGSCHMIGCHKRSDPVTAYAKAEIERLKASGELGNLRYVRIIMPAEDWMAGGFNELISSDEAVPLLPADPPPHGLNEEHNNH